MASAPPPIPEDRLQQIAQDACASTLSTATSYTHAQTESWNTSIISAILQGLIAAASTASSPLTTQYKYAVNSTIIQHLDSSSSSSAAGAGGSASSPPTTPPAGSADAAQTSAGETAVQPSRGRRGMHSAMGCYWNAETDGKWSMKWEGKGMDVVVSVVWVAAGPAGPSSGS